jgi:hypothetical protein
VSFLGGGATAAAEAPISKRFGARTSWRAVVAMAWPPVLVASVYLAVGRLGFYPTDEGLNQAYSYRILHGEVPHRDFISPRPLGSALLHLIDFAIPGPLFEVSRVIAMAEYTAYGILFAWLIYNFAPWRWGALAAGAAAATVLVNLNSFPLMAWYTADGLLLVAAGYLVIDRGVRRRSIRVVAVGFLLLGIAALTKQSFAPGPAFGWLLLLPWLRELRWGVRFRALVGTGVLGSLPTIAFVAAISLLGGFTALRTQLLGAGLVYGRSLVAAWSPRHDLLVLGPVVAAAAILLAVIQVSKQRPNAVPGLVALGSRVGLTVLVVSLPLQDRLGLVGNDWGTRVLWIAVVTSAVQSFVERKLDGVGIALLGAGWMASLSYGYAWPNLVGGSMVLYVIHRAWVGVKISDLAPRRFRAAALALALIGVVAIGYVFTTTRLESVYLDRPADRLTASLNGTSAAFGDLRTNPETSAYLQQMAECVRAYPARSVAILPENAAMYVALSLHNPFPTDWLWPGDYNGSEARILATTDVLNREGDYLVMFQTVGDPELVSGTPLPQATLASPIHTYSPLTNEIYDRLAGRRTTCGTFLVVYAPPKQ